MENVNTQKMEPVPTTEEREREEVQKINEAGDYIEKKLSQTNSTLTEEEKNNIIEKVNQIIEDFGASTASFETTLQKLDEVLKSIPEKKPEDSPEQKRLDLLDKLKRNMPVDHREILEVAKGVGVEINELGDSVETIINKLEAVAREKTAVLKAKESKREDTEQKIRGIELRIINLENLAQIAKTNGNDAQAHNYDEERRVLQEQLDQYKLHTEQTPEVLITLENTEENTRMEQLKDLGNEVIREKKQMAALATDEGRKQLDQIHEAVNAILTAQIVGMPTEEALEKIEKLRKEIQTVEKLKQPGYPTLTMEAVEYDGRACAYRVSPNLNPPVIIRNVERVANENNIAWTPEMTSDELLVKIRERINEQNKKPAEARTEKKEETPNLNELLGPLNKRWYANAEHMGSEDILAIPKLNELARLVAERPEFTNAGEIINTAGILEKVFSDMTADPNISPNGALSYIQSEFPLAIAEYETSQTLIQKNDTQGGVSENIPEIGGEIDFVNKYSDLTKEERERLLKLRRLSELRLLIKKAEKKQDEAGVLKLEDELHALEKEILPKGEMEEIKKQLDCDIAISRGNSVTPVKEIEFAEDVQEIPLSDSKKQEINQKANEIFLFSEAELNNIEHISPEGVKTRFSDLSPGRQKLLLLNLKGFAVENAKDQALKKFTEEKGEKLSWWKRPFQTFIRVSRIAKYETEILKDEKNKEAYKKVLTELLGMAAGGPEAWEADDGKLYFFFAVPEDFDGSEEQLSARIDFNEAASKFAGVSAEWAYSKNKKERTAFKEAEQEYAKARQDLLKTKFKDGEFEAQKFVASLDTKVQFTQVFNTYPDAEKEFAKMADRSGGWKEGVREILSERAKLFALGTVTRTAAAIGVGALLGGLMPVGMIGAAAIAGGAAGGAIGGFMSYKRHKQMIEDTKTLLKMGVDEKAELKKLYQYQQETYDYDKETNTFTPKIGKEKTREVFSGAEDMTKKLKLSLDRLYAPMTRVKDGIIVEITNPEEIAEIQTRRSEMVAERLYYTEQKMSIGLVKYGEGAEGAKDRYELFRALAQARAHFEMSEPAMMKRTIERNFKVDKYGKRIFGEAGADFSSKTKQEYDLREYINDIFGIQKRIELEETAYQVSKGIIMGAITGAAASSLMQYIRTASESIPGTIPKNVATEAAKDGVLEIKAGAVDEAMNQIRQPHTVVSGENVWNIIKVRLSDNEIFSKLPPRQQNFVIDSLKDKISHLSPAQIQEIGIKSGDPNRIYAGETLHFDKVFKDSDILMRAFNRVASAHGEVVSAPAEAVEPSTPSIIDQMKERAQEVFPGKKPGVEQGHVQHQNTETHPAPHHHQTQPTQPIAHTDIQARPTPQTPTIPEIAPVAPSGVIRYTSSFNQWVAKQIGNLPQGAYDFFYNNKIRGQIAGGHGEDVMRIGNEINRYLGLGRFEVNSITQKETWSSYIFRQMRDNNIPQTRSIPLRQLLGGGETSNPYTQPVANEYPGLVMDRREQYWSEMNARRGLEAMINWRRQAYYRPPIFIRGHRPFHNFEYGHYGYPNRGGRYGYPIRGIRW